MGSNGDTGIPMEAGASSSMADMFGETPRGVLAVDMAASPSDGVHDLGLLNDVEITATVELGRTAMVVRDVLKLRRGSVIEMDKLVGQPADLLINGTPMAKGEIIVINERFGFRVTHINSPIDAV